MNSFYFVALPLVAAILSSICIGSVKGQYLFSGGCEQSLPEIVASGNPLVFAFGILHELGRYDICDVLPTSRFCTANLAVLCVEADNSTKVLQTINMCASTPVLGLCMPLNASCPTSEINAQLFAQTAYDTSFQQYFGQNSSCVARNLPQECTNRSVGFLLANCMDELPSFTSDPKAVAVFAVVVTLCSICVLASLVRCACECAKECGDRHGSDDADDDNENTSLVARARDGASASVNVKGNAGHGDTDGRKPSSTRGDGGESGLSLRGVLLWFDLANNAREFTIVAKRNVGDIDTRFFEGIRVIAMLFVLFGHALYFPTLANIYNTPDLIAYLRSYASIGIFPAELAVDTFFFLSGFLFLHLYLKYAEKAARTQALDYVPHPTVPTILLMYIRRYLRMTPVVMLTMVMTVWLFIYIPTGTMHDTLRLQPMLQDCHEFWWHQLLYITNLHDVKNWTMCMAWFWYLSADFQLFIAGPLLAAPLFFNRKLGMAFLVAIIITVTGIQTQEQYGAYLGSNGTYYDKAYIRCNGYVYGMLGAVLVRIRDVREWFSSQRLRRLCHLVAIVLGVSCINVMWLGMRCYEQHNFGLITSCPHNYYALMNAYNCGLWGLALLCMSLPWCFGYGGPVQEFLSAAPFAVLSKLTFCCYMIHPVAILIKVSDGFGYPQFSTLLQYSNFASATLLTFPAALVLHLVAEIPFAKLNDALTKMR